MTKDLLVWFEFKFIIEVFLIVDPHHPSSELHCILFLTCSGVAVESRISVSVSPGWKRITSTMSLLVLELDKSERGV